MTGRTLADGREVALDTDPTDRDTDGDGLPGGAEVRSDVLAGGDPRHSGVYVELDHHESCSVDREGLAALEETFANARVSNPDGEEGIALHVVVDDELTNRARPDRIPQGHHYVALVPAVQGDGVPGRNLGFRSRVQCSHPVVLRRTVIMHELGHSLGLSPALHRGIDSREVPAGEYPSVMNYNAYQDVTDYSTGTRGSGDFDDWGWLASNLRTPPVDGLDTA